MSSYLSYGDYINLGGELDVDTFNRYAFRAENAIDFRTFDRLHKIDLTQQSERFIYALNMTMYELISLYVAQDSYMGLVSATRTDASGNTVPDVRLLGQSNDGVTVTYNVAQAKDAMSSLNAQIDKAIQTGLQGLTYGLGKKLLWRGIYPDE